MSSLYAELQWLPRAPQDFSQRVKALKGSPGSLGREVHVLAQHGLDINQLTRLGRVISTAILNQEPLDPLTPFRLAVLSNSP